ncbi:MAG: hypothetical protein ACTSYI_04475 [Promethearchaeota archaeon]
MQKTLQKTKNRLIIITLVWILISILALAFLPRMGGAKYTVDEDDWPATWLYYNNLSDSPKSVTIAIYSVASYDYDMDTVNKLWGGEAMKKGSGLTIVNYIIPPRTGLRIFFSWLEYERDEVPTITVRIIPKTVQTAVFITIPTGFGILIILWAVSITMARRKGNSDPKDMRYSSHIQKSENRNG